MWRLVLGAILSALPRRWRDRMRVDQATPWVWAVVLSGFLEALLALLGLTYWYSHSVTTWAANAMDSALRNGPEAQVPGQAIGFSALLLWLLHPLTWFIGFFAIEGVVRLLAAVSTEQVHGSLPLVVADWCYGKLTGRPPEGDALHVPSGKAQMKLLVIAVKEKVATARSPEVEDELEEYGEGDQAMLEIRASRPKGEWVPPRVVRIGEAYYRLEQALRGKPPRPFIFQLRRLPAGVPGRTVIAYELPRSTDDVSEESD